MFMMCNVVDELFDSHLDKGTQPEINRQEDDIGADIEILSLLKYLLSKLKLSCIEVIKDQRWLVMIGCNMCTNIRLFLVIKDENDERSPVGALARVVFDLVQNSFLDQHCRLLIGRGFYCPQDFDALQPKKNNDFPNQLARLCENYRSGTAKKKPVICVIKH